MVEGLADQTRHLPRPGFNDLGEPSPGPLFRPEMRTARQGDHLLGEALGGVAMAVSAFEHLSLVLVTAQAGGKIDGDVLATDREHHDAADGAALEDGDV